MTSDKLKRAGRARRAWSADDVTLLRAQRNAGHSIDEIARGLNRSSKAVADKANKLGVLLPSRRRHRRWQPQEIAALRQLVADGATSVQVAKHLNRPLGSVYWTAAKLGLSWRRRSRSRSSSSADRIMAMHKAGMKQSAIAAALDVSRQWVSHIIRARRE